MRWSQRRERIFLEILADSANITRSAEAAGVSETTVYRQRRKSEDFRAAWAVALREGLAKLEMMLLDRAMNGVEKAIWYGGEVKGVMREYDNRTAFNLLAMHRPGGRGGGGRPQPDEPAPEPVPIEQLRADLKARLSMMNKRMGGAG